jgi:hemin uptake protein HemP
MSNDNVNPAPIPQQLPVCHRADDPCQVCRGIAGMRILTSDELLHGQRELLILHAGQIYRLLRTRKDKLILQK